MGSGWTHDILPSGEDLPLTDGFWWKRSQLHFRDTVTDKFLLLHKSPSPEAHLQWTQWILKKSWESWKESGGKHSREIEREGNMW